MQRPQTWDVRATGVKGGKREGLSLLVQAVHREEAELLAKQTCEDSGWREVAIQWASVYPPHRPRAVGRAITDD